MEQVRDLLNQIRLPAIAAPIILIALGLVVFFFKRALNVRDERKRKRSETLQQYAALQEKALFEAYRMLYEQVNLKALSPTEFIRIVSQADDLIMEPFTAYRAHLDDKLIARLHDLHNIVAQYKPDPAFPREVTRGAIDNLVQYRESLLRDVESFRDMIRKYC